MHQNSSTSRQDALAGLRKWTLVRDDESDPGGRIYRDSNNDVFHSVTRILSATAPQHQRDALERWLARPDSEAERQQAATRGTLAHNHAEYILKTAKKLAIHSANRRNAFKTGSDGLERAPKGITAWSLDKAIQGAPSPAWSAAGYARGLRHWIEANVTAIHAVEFSIHHPAGFAGTCDALLDINGKGPIVTDWKTSTRERSEEMLVNYQDQLGAYSLGLRELTGIRAKGGVIVLARRTGAPQVRMLSELELRGCESRFLERCEQYFGKLK